MKASNIHFGTCSWNYDSWKGIVYSNKSTRAAYYLPEYAQMFPTVEIDSWFYKIPSEKEVQDYMIASGGALTFACKLFNGITLTHYRPKERWDPLVKNENFLSVTLFNRYIQAITLMHEKLVAVELEFEYLNKQKMPSLEQFLKYLDQFFSGIDHTVPLAVEVRNKNFIHKEYFSLLKQWNVSHVFSEKEYMPHIYDVYDTVGDMLTDTVIVRLLGENRQQMEIKAGGGWNALVEEKHDITRVGEMITALSERKRHVFVYVNNHYEGSAPLTIKKLKSMM